MAMDILNRLGPQPDPASVRPSVVKSTSDAVTIPGGAGQLRGTKTVAPVQEQAAPARQALDTAKGSDAVKGMVKQLNEAVQTVRRELEFSVDDESGRTVVKVKDSQTGEVIRQMPAEEALEVARHIQAFVESRAVDVDGDAGVALGIIMKTQA